MDEQPFTDNPHLDRFLTKLADSVTDGFVGVNNRLDTLNGKVAKHEEHNGQTIIWKSEVNGALKVLMILVPIMVSLVGWMAWEVTHLDGRIREVLESTEIIIKTE